MNKDIVNVIFGDSIAYGLYDNEYWGWWNRLKTKDENMSKSFYFNLSIPGQSSIDIAKRFQIEFENRYNIDDDFNIIFAFGIKDALLLNENPNHLKLFEDNIINTINHSKKYNTNIYFLGLLDVDLKERTQYQQENIDIIDKTLEKICNENKVSYINMKNIIDIKELTDGLHPNSIGHTKIADHIYKSIFQKENTDNSLL